MDIVEILLISVLTTALFAVVTMLGIALFQLPARFERALGEVRGEVRDLRGEVRDLRGEVRDLRGEVRELRERFEEHLRAHGQPV